MQISDSRLAEAGIGWSQKSEFGVRERGSRFVRPEALLPATKAAACRCRNPKQDAETGESSTGIGSYEPARSSLMRSIALPIFSIELA